jgi:hypothetical protein
MLKVALIASVISVASLVSFSNSASAVVLGNFNSSSNNEGWTRTTSSPLMTNSPNTLGTGLNGIGNASGFLGFATSGSASLFKTVTVGNAGDTINFSFDVSSFVSGGTGILSVFANGLNLVTYNTNAFTATTNQMFSFVSQGADTYRFDYAGRPNSGFGIDNVIATATPPVGNNTSVPEPAETAGLILFAGAAIILKRKMAKANANV